MGYYFAIDQQLLKNSRLLSYWAVSGPGLHFCIYSPVLFLSFYQKL